MIIHTYMVILLFVSLCQTQLIKEVKDKLIFTSTAENGTESLVDGFQLSNFRFIKKVSASDQFIIIFAL